MQNTLRILLRSPHRARHSSSTAQRPFFSAANNIVLKPYGVLGTALDTSGNLRQVEEPPRDGVAFVDPAGLHCIQHLGPSGAGGASASIYRYLQIASDASFPSRVREAITEPMQAKAHLYSLSDQLKSLAGANRSTARCIHCVGPDFSSAPIGRERAVELLATAYTNVLLEFDEARSCSTLRILPISGGAFAGPFQHEIGALTRDALDVTCKERLNKQLVQRLINRRLELCIFMEAELAQFAEAWRTP